MGEKEKTLIFALIVSFWGSFFANILFNKIKGSPKEQDELPPASG
jgi:hypothetical protein